MNYLKQRTNALRRLPDDSYTLTCSSNPRALCDACADSQHCSRTKRENIIKSCKEFTPVFIFSVTDNLDADEYNTLRIGQAWSKRLKLGQRIGIHNKDTGELSFAKVRGVYWHDDKEKMLLEHAAMNHIGMTLELPELEMGQVLQNSYGKGFYSKSKGLTAVYLSPIRQ